MFFKKIREPLQLAKMSLMIIEVSSAVVTDAVICKLFHRAQFLLLDKRCQFQLFIRPDLISRACYAN